MYFLGIDGGGTKTQIILSDEKANILGISVAPPTYLRTVSQEDLAGILENGILETIKNSAIKDVSIKKSCFGIAGLDSEKDFETLATIIKSFSKVKLDTNPLILNDCVCALRRGTDKGFGISIVGGTGSNCYGKSKFGSETFVGGLGHVLSDEGGSFYIGQKVLRAVAKSYDGRIEKTLLEEMVCEHFGVLNVRDLIPIIYSKNFGKTEVARLSVVCENASEKGDSASHQILEEAAKELVLLVVTAAKKLNMTNDSFDLVCVGGSFRRPYGPIRKYFERDIKKALKKAAIVHPTTEPAMGAVFLAIDKVIRAKK